MPQPLPLWLTPLVLLVGNCLLTASTSTRHTRCLSELRQTQASAGDEQAPSCWLLRRRSRLLGRALVGLCASVASLALASLAGGAAALGYLRPAWPALSLSVLGTAGLLFGAVELVRETILATQDPPSPARTPAGEPGS